MCWKQKRGIRSQGRFAHVVTFIRKVHFDSPLVLKSTRERERERNRRRKNSLRFKWEWRRDEVVTWRAAIATAQRQTNENERSKEMWTRIWRIRERRKWKRKKGRKKKVHQLVVYTPDLGKHFLFHESEDSLPGTHSDSSLFLNSFFFLFSPDVSRFISKFVWSSKIL